MCSEINRTFANNVLSLCVEKFVDAGFTKFKGSNIYMKSKNGFHGWVGLNQGLYSDRFQINPYVGIHCEPIERLISQLRGTQYDRCIASLSTHMGSLAPQEDIVVFYPEQQLELEVERLVNLYVTYGLPYYKEHQTYESLLPYFLDKAELLGGYPESIAVTYFLMGEYEASKGFVEAFRRKEPDYFETFATAFSKYVTSNT